MVEYMKDIYGEIYDRYIWRNMWRIYGGAYVEDI